VKTKFLFLALLSSVLFSQVQAQTFSSAKVCNYQDNQPAQPGIVKAEMPTTGSGHIVFGTQNFNTSFLTFQKSNGNWSASGTLTAGTSYTFGIGDYTVNPNGDVTVVTYANIGAGISGGVMANPDANGIQGTVNIYGTVGIYNYIQLAGGIDVVNKRPFVGIGANVPLFTFKKGATGRIFKLF
jgi:hypothetical protein